MSELYRSAKSTPSGDDTFCQEPWVTAQTEEVPTPLPFENALGLKFKRKKKTS